MSTPAHAGPVRVRMSYDDYRELSPDLRAEWVDGEVVMTPSPSWRHQQAARRLANILEAALPDLHVVEAVTVVLSEEYLAAGVTQYWLLDPEERILDIFVRAEGGWAPLARLDPAAPTATVEVRGHGSVPLHLQELLRET